MMNRYPLGIGMSTKGYIIRCEKCNTMLIMPDVTKDVAIQLAEYSGWWYNKQSKKMFH